MARALMVGPIVCFGELLLRLTAPGNGLLLQRHAFDVHVGGAEANVAVGLACLGWPTRMVSRVPDNAIGHGAVSALRATGVDISGVSTGPGRMGLYFLSQGAGLRASEIVYDRAASAFADAAPEVFDWDRLLDGASRLHLSGITPALGSGPARAALAAASTAARQGIPVSLDGNYRAKLWESWDSNPRAILTDLVGHADILFGNHRDIALLLGQTFSGDSEERRREAANAAFAAFPELRLIASTARSIASAECHRIAARIDARDRAVQSAEISVSGIIDRIGTGDAFAAGVLHGLGEHGDAIEQGVHAGLALTVLKHALPGDSSLFRQADIDAFWAGGLDVRR